MRSMLWVLLATAAALVPQQSGHAPDVRGILRGGDYPPEALARGEVGTVIAQLVIDDTGNVESCSVVQSSRSESLDRATFRILQTRARFKPAGNESGPPIYAVMLAPPITWILDGRGKAVVELLPDAEIGINQAPEGLTLPTDISVSYVVSANGQIKSCQANNPSQNAQPVAIACDAANLPKPVIFRNKAGKAVDVMYTSKARFVLGKP